MSARQSAMARAFGAPPTIPNEHPWRRIVGLTSPLAKEIAIAIECRCGHISSGATFKLAIKAHRAHQGIA